MSSVPAPPFLSAYWQDAFAVKQHLQEFLHLDPETLERKLEASCQTLAELEHRDFDWEKAAEFYGEQVGTAYLFELAAWHLESRDYIGSTLRLIAERARGRVLDFGGGIGTHAIAAALCPQVTQVVYLDINPINRQFVQYRADQLGLSQKLLCPAELPPAQRFETILCFDVLEHLPSPSQQLLEFDKLLAPTGKMILNWYFFKGFAGEFPFHLDEPRAVETFFRTLQGHFLEEFHPYLITARCYQKLTNQQE